MTRKLEDVAHFFLGAGLEEPSSFSAHEERHVRRLVYVISTAEALPGAIVAAGFAAVAAHRGKRVLAAEVQGRPFGVLFALGVGAQAGGYRMAMIDTPCGVRVLASPLSGSILPGCDLYPEDLHVVQDQWRQSELVVVHIEKEYLDRASSELTPPDDCVIVASEALPDGQSEAYHAIKRLLFWKSDMRVALIASGDSGSEPPLSRVREAVLGFLRRDCSVLGRITEPSGLAAHFLSGSLLGQGWADVRRVLEPMVTRWMASPVSESTRSLGGPLWSTGSSPSVLMVPPEGFPRLDRRSHLPGGRPGASTALTPGPWASPGTGLDRQG
jgi:hypothetical protein